MAIGVMRALSEVGLRIPEDISIIGVDDIDCAAYQNPPLTTVRQSKVKFYPIFMKIFNLLLPG
ncbi:MAG: substrate-binding domain-containing protein [Gillisia sp.]